MEKLMDKFGPNDVTPKVFSDSVITDMTKENVTTALKVASKLFNCKIILFYKSESGCDFGEIVNASSLLEAPLYILLEDNSGKYSPFLSFLIVYSFYQISSLRPSSKDTL